MLAFSAVVVNMILIRKSCLKDYWNLKDWSQNTPFFPAILNYDLMLSNGPPLLHASVYVLHFPESNGETGKLKKVQYIVKHFSEQFRCYYMPKRD